MPRPATTTKSPAAMAAPPCVLGVEFSSHVAPFRTAEVAQGLSDALGDHPELHLQVRLDPGGFQPSVAEADAVGAITALLGHPRVATIDAADPRGWLDAWLGTVEAYFVPAVTSAFHDLHEAAVQRGIPVLAPETVPATLGVRPHFVADLVTGRTSREAIRATLRSHLAERGVVPGFGRN